MKDYSADSRSGLIDDLHKMCGHCTGTGSVMSKDGYPEPCPNGAVHSDINSHVEFALESAERNNEVLKTFSEMQETNHEMAQVIVEFTTQLQAIGEAAGNVTTSLDDIKNLVYADYKDSSINGIRAAVLREVIGELHYELNEGTCVCGDNWSEEDMCAEARRILNLADKFSSEDDEEEE